MTLGLGSRFGFRAQGSEDLGSGFYVGLGFRISRFGFRVSGFGFRLRVEGWEDMFPMFSRHPVNSSF